MDRCSIINIKCSVLYRHSANTMEAHAMIKWILIISFLLMLGSMGNIWAAWLDIPIWIGGTIGIITGAVLIYLEVEVD